MDVNFLLASNKPFATGPPQKPKSTIEKLLYKLGVILFMKTSVLPFIVFSIFLILGGFIFIFHLTVIKYMAMTPETIYPSVVKRGCNIKSDFFFINTNISIVKRSFDSKLKIVIYFIFSIA